MKILFCLVAAFSGAVSQADTIDQSAPMYSVNMASFRSDVNITIAQSFKQSAANISGAGFFMTPNLYNTFTHSVTVSLYDNLPNNGGMLRGVLQGAIKAQQALPEIEELFELGRPE